MTGPRRPAGLPAAYLQTGSSSFTEFVADFSPDLLPGRRVLPSAAPETLAPHGTTIVTATYDGGLVMAGDRRATLGNIIAGRDIDKVFVTDEHSAVGIAGTAGLAVELVKLFQVELEHFEKIEGAQLSLEGKANRLATMIRGNLGLALQGLPVVPLFAGFDPSAQRPDLQLRRHRRLLRGARPSRRRVGGDLRPRLAQEAVAPRPRCRGDPARGRRGPL